MAQFVSDWRVRDFAPGEGGAAGAALGKGDGWIAAAAPGDIHVALIAAGRLADPYRGRGEADAAWVRHREWWWHADVDLAPAVSGERVELVFDGLDTFADIFIDGVMLGAADNMFRSWRFDLAGVAPGRHRIALCFHPAIACTGDAPLPRWSVFTDRITASRRTAMRKAQFGWGWDWGPDLPTVGIWRPVRIERGGAARAESINFTTLKLAEDHAEVEIAVALTEAVEAVVELRDPGGAPIATMATDGTAPLRLDIADPQLWWTADLGAQPLYSVVVRVPGSPDLHRQVGIRTIAIDESPDPDEPGTHFFRFVLNGVPIFAKGVNWVPASSFVGAIADETYRDLLQRAADAKMNMIRVWGGGIYEPDIFHDICDRIGLLVWQDFMFACAPYPDDDPAFVETIRCEVVEQVSRLRHHASLALWCGNNENQAIQFFADHEDGTATPLAGQAYYDELIPGVLARLDPLTPYRPSSPWGGPSPNSMRAGDVHNWTVWHGVPPVPDRDVAGAYESTPEGVAFTRYAEDMARFVSEFGLQGAPDLGTLRRWLAPEDLVLGSRGFLDRIKDVADKASAMMIPLTGLPESLEQFVDYSMLAQAEGLAFGIAHYRRRKPHCSGALVWQYNDCWPSVSWSLIDYDGVAKASHYAVARAFSPVAASFRRDGDRVEFWVVNDTLLPVADRAVIELERLAGGVDWSQPVEIAVPANASRCVWRGTVADAADRVLTARAVAGLFPAERLLPAAVKDLALDPDPGLSARWGAGGVAITAARYALAVRLRSDVAALRFSDNHFDLKGGETRVIGISDTRGHPVDPATIDISCWGGQGRARVKSAETRTS